MLVIIIVIVILLCSILGGVGYWKREDLFGTGEDDAALAEAEAAALAAEEAAALAEAEAAALAEAEAAALAAAAVGGGTSALGESCSVKTCESPLVCDEYSMTCGHAPVKRDFAFTIDGNEYSRSAINPLYRITLDEDTDTDPTKTPWVLVLNYVHKGGTNPGLNIRTTSKGFPVLPENGTLDFNTFNINATIQDGGAANPGSWGHTGNDLFNKTCIALGSATGNDSGVEVRFVGKTNDHPRIINFKTSLFGFLKDFRYGDQPIQTGSLTEGTDFTLLDNHSAVLPRGRAGLFGFGNSNDLAMTTHTFFIGNERHWEISSHRWEVDNYIQNASKNTYHQIWVRADKP